MKNKLISIAVILMMAISIGIPATTATADAATSFTVRTSIPDYNSTEGKKWYYTNDNLYYKNNYAPNLKYLSSRRGYCRGNCTWYAYSRASETTGKWMNKAFSRNAGKWYGINKAGGYYKYGTEPKVGAVACYSGHVAFVEKIVNGKVYVSESGWKISATKPTKSSQLYFHYGTPWVSKAVGYIYVNEPGTTSTDATQETKSVNYKVSITSKTLNMRIGAGTQYASKGYIKPGTYTVKQECGKWGKLDNGYWIYLDYATKVISTTETTKNNTVVSNNAVATTSANYKVKIVTMTLNMRTGAGTQYKSKGFIKPGTYTVKQVSGGWGKLDNGYWVYLKYTTKVTNTTTTTTTTTATTKATTSSSSSSAKFNVKVQKANLAMRSGAGAKYSKKGTVTKGKVYGIKAIKNGYGQLASNNYWIALYRTTLSGTFKIKITASDLNMRSGAATSFASKGHVAKGTYTVKSIKNGWCQLSKNNYWVSMSFIKLV